MKRQSNTKPFKLHILTSYGKHPCKPLIDHLKGAQKTIMDEEGGKKDMPQKPPLLFLRTAPLMVIPLIVENILFGCRSSFVANFRYVYFYFFLRDLSINNFCFMARICKLTLIHDIYNDVVPVHLCFSLRNRIQRDICETWLVCNKVMHRAEKSPFCTWGSDKHSFWRPLPSSHAQIKFAKIILQCRK